MLFEELTGKVIAAAMVVHTEMGPGLFEQVYKACLKHLLFKQGVKTSSEVNVPVVFQGAKLEIGYRIDILVEETLVVELKSVERLASVHKAQLLNYLKLGRFPVGLLLNFNVPHMKDGIVRVLNTFPPPCPPCPPC